MGYTSVRKSNITTYGATNQTTVTRHSQTILKEKPCESIRGMNMNLIENKLGIILSNARVQ
ncbi:MAG: hypothetical protein WAM14_12050 [Candidatus Nitrosopolaris sp.]